MAVDILKSGAHKMISGLGMNYTVVFTSEIIICCHCIGKLQALVTSLGSDATVDDIKEYFETLCEALCEDNIEVSCVTKLGRGKAELILSGISSSGEYN